MRLQTRGEVAHVASYQTPLKQQVTDGLIATVALLKAPPHDQ